MDVDATGFPMWKPVDAQGGRSRWAPEAPTKVGVSKIRLLMHGISQFQV